jgi:hypothetical protein
LVSKCIFLITVFGSSRFTENCVTGNLKVLPLCPMSKSTQDFDLSLSLPPQVSCQSGKLLIPYLCSWLLRELSRLVPKQPRAEQKNICRFSDWEKRGFSVILQSQKIRVNPKKYFSCRKRPSFCLLRHSQKLSILPSLFMEF